MAPVPVKALHSIARDILVLLLPLDLSCPLGPAQEDAQLDGPSPGILGLPLAPPGKSTPSPWNELFPLSPPGRCTMKWEGCTLLKKGVFFLPIAPPRNSCGSPRPEKVVVHNPKLYPPGKFGFCNSSVEGSIL